MNNKTDFYLAFLRDVLDYHQININDIESISIKNGSMEIKLIDAIKTADILVEVKT